MIKGNYVILSIKNDVVLLHIPSIFSLHLGIKHSKRRKMVLMSIKWAQVEMVGNAESIMGNTEVLSPELQRTGKSVTWGI